MSAENCDLTQIIAGLSSDYSALGNLIRRLDHQVECEYKHVTVRAYYLPFRNGQPMVGELLDQIRTYICNFALNRADVNEAHAAAKGLTDQKRLEVYIKLRDAAADTFIKAHKDTNRNGECGELLLYLLTEWALGAPQILAKMPFKTSAQMPVHGSDGIHVRYDETTDKLHFIWGEAKLHASVSGAIASAIASISEAIQYEKMKRDISLVKSNFHLSGLPDDVKPKILDYLNPLKPNYHNKIDVSACLIGFDFAKFSEFALVDADKLEDVFSEMLRASIIASAKILDSQIKDAGLSHHLMEVFFFPVPSVSALRVEFQNLIGWKND